LVSADPSPLAHPPPPLDELAQQLAPQHVHVVGDGQREAVGRGLLAVILVATQELQAATPGRAKLLLARARRRGPV